MLSLILENLKCFLQYYFWDLRKYNEILFWYEWT
jgi:hypothetical protein